MGTQQLNKEQSVGHLFNFYVRPAIEGNEAKKQAVGRYMRTYLRALTLPELEFELNFSDVNGFVSPNIEFKINQASKGYDRFMARRGVKRPAP